MEINYGYSINEQTAGSRISLYSPILISISLFEIYFDMKINVLNSFNNISRVGLNIFSHMNIIYLYKGCEYIEYINL